MGYLAKTPEGLLPCPHCGGESEARDGSSTTPYIRCKSCGCRTGASYDMDKLKEAWNRRAERTCSLPIVRDEEECERQAGVGVFVAQEIPLCRKCTSCGRQYPPVARLPEGLRYCPYCGARVIGEETRNAD